MSILVSESEGVDIVRDFKFSGIDHVQVAIPKNTESTARNFYVEKLGMMEIQKPENLRKKGGLWLVVGKHQLHLGVMEEFSPATKAHPAFDVENLESYRLFLQRNGVAAIDEDILAGASRFYVKDPFGNRIEFLEWKKT